MSPNKALEKQIVEEVIRAGLLPQGEIDDTSESPDIRLTTPNEKIGVEVTGYHSSEKERQRTERFENYFLPKMLKRLREVGGRDYDYLRGTIYTREEYFPSSSRMEDKFVEELVNVIVNDENINNTKKSNNRKRIEINAFSGYPLLYKWVSRIICHWTEYVDEPSWQWGPFTVRFVGLTPEKLKEILDVKREKVEGYRKKSFKKLNLVIHSGMHLVCEFGKHNEYEISQLQEACKKELENSGFDVVIIFNSRLRQGDILYNSTQAQNTVCR
ncbi:MAG TPA: hypothetical protein ACFYD2_00025 [Candidatus Avalokitesvara rifleensis]|uniref:hypothetical protein n=1 Tax=Candidatus Avalokitesvara rifleensis TaxID=3367620 RepID=UPI002713435D|nr:hypothetical protein [Candidatus Brocadiales bacterium]